MGSFILFLLGLILFLYGLNWMRNGMESLAEKKLTTWLLRFTKTPVRGFVTGTFLTALLQSSTAVTVLTINFVHVGMISFAQSLGIILGSNIGTTITTQILALHIESLSLPLMGLGLLLYFLPKKLFRQLGQVLIGFGAIFLGISWMQTIAEPLEQAGLLEKLVLSGFSPIGVGLVIGTLITALIHSSSATIAMTMGFYASGAVPLSFALAVVIGSNVGTCVTALIASYGTSTAAQRVAFSHLVLNVVGAFAFTPLIPWLLTWIPSLSEQSATQVAHFQTIYNIACSIAVLPFTNAFAKLIEWMVPDQINPTNSIKT
ncbi:Na/Pi cotransporter family protein [Risungbinella massiliensis]|uniref:Na/Pi cotransporter family protein n=1 Tax=Risungbinella massiliensis TaxID=1329796 RepID=UPI0005CBCFB7|nr:Na/Pi symporter [Risungbinella massiliensis]